MNRPLLHTRRAIGLRLLAANVLWLLPLLAAVGAWGVRLQAPLGAGLAAAALSLLAFVAWHRQRARHDDRWLARRLNADPAMQDSADLLFAPPQTLGPLQGLQQAHVAKQLGRSAIDPRPAWPRRALVAAFLTGTIAVLAAVVLPPSAAPMAAPAPAAAGVADADAAPTILTLHESSVTVEPPGYTGLPTRQEPGLSLQAPAGSTLRWQLRFSPQPDAVALRWHDGGELALVRDGEHWVGEHTLARSLLYRIQTTSPLPLADDDLHRLDAIADQAPTIRVVSPERPLTLRADGQRRWLLDFEASDDHGLGDARLFITLAQGSGEQVQVSERSLALRGEGEPTLRRYRHTLDLDALGLAQGDDLIARLEVSDQRTPAPQTSRSPSLILRWPMPPATESTGMEGLVQKALPAYFRSQRQIILDIEALVPQRPTLPADDFVKRSDVIGVDQRILRMRYGQFLGEENEGGPEPPPGLDDGQADGHDDGPAHTDDDGHDHAGDAAGPLGGAVNVLEQYGHTHDDAEAATLLDPQTRALLRQALDAMWSSEGELRQGQPERALPHAYRALQFIKQVQQASRIYLARVGLELPPIEESRRMGGDREGIADRRDGLVPAQPAPTPVPALWLALAQENETPDLAPMTAWLDDNAERIADPLSLLAALETLRADPGCTACRQRLRALLWPLLPRPTTGPDGRPAPDAMGQAYLDALPAEATP
ncbi:DUF4175 family protein [Arenimonas donghaensis]|uniref:DUF4175 domain-containing protein n=1 Tax=Arenimonas donghaensis DSM 18148 = HO3-R19 TaxID=1121014 RepID=A0A087MJE0_9GAMM|nr:DUF4175 family protein [Arenimonas donghaensis]KFL36993.1 hypothetical protein N788_12150 [Arenimonas donghaensis DSM 18148 = HO3-R19]